MDEQALLTYLRLHYWNRDNLQIRNLQNITTGWETEIRSFDLEWTEGGENKLQKLVARIYPSKNAGPRVQKEATTMKQLVELGYPVPIVHIIETEPSHLGQPFMIMDRIDGGILDDKIRDDREKWSKVYSNLFVKLHRLDWRKMHDTPEEIPAEDPYYFIRTTLSRFKQILEKSQRLDLLPIVTWLQDRMDEVPCSTLSIIHGDFHPMNILVDEHEKTYVIDWGASQIADYRVDLAWTLVLTYAYASRELRDEVLRGYETSLGSAVKQIEYFEVLGTLRRLHDVTSSFAKGSDEIGMRPEALDMIRETIGHVVRVRDRLEELTEIRIPEIDAFNQKLSE